jgi:hypothetical protein
MIQNSLDLAYAMELLSLLTESAEKYIDDGTWIEPLTDDLKNAKQAIKKYNRLISKEKV